MELDLFSYYHKVSEKISVLNDLQKQLLATILFKSIFEYVSNSVQIQYSRNDIALIKKITMHILKFGDIGIIKRDVDILMENNRKIEPDENLYSNEHVKYNAVVIFADSLEHYLNFLIVRDDSLLISIYDAIVNLIDYDLQVNQVKNINLIMQKQLENFDSIMEDLFISKSDFSVKVANSDYFKLSLS